MFWLGAHQKNQRNFKATPKMSLSRGDLLIPSLYMEMNGSKISGVIVDTNPSNDTIRVYLNNGKDCWYDTKTITDLFNIVKFRT
jgi:hypothetical protein